MTMTMQVLNKHIVSQKSQQANELDQLTSIIRPTVVAQKFQENERINYIQKSLLERNCEQT